MKLSSVGVGQQAGEGEEKKCLNSELWHACAGPLVCLPTLGTRVVYFPQGHSEQVAASTNKEVEGHIPNYPSLPPQLFCQLHDVIMHADVETDEVYAQMTLQPLSMEEQKDTYFPMELGIMSKQPTNYFCKTLTASDTSTHGGFSVPRRAAEKVFPPLDFSQQPPAQELIARDIHDVEWKFRHIFRGQPKRHLLTTGWSVFVSAKRLVAGDSVLFIWNEKNQLLLGIRRANRPQTVMPSSVLSSDSMHIGLLAAAAHAASTNSRFTIFFNPRASPSEFVVPLSKYVKAVFHTRVSVGMRFRMLFETEESSVRRYMGTITGIGDLDPVHWPNSHWRSVKVGWDESAAGERQPRVSLWEIEPLTTFPMYPSFFPLRLKRPYYPGGPFPFDANENELNALIWPRGIANDQSMPSLNFPSIGMGSWPQKFEPLAWANELNQYQAVSSAALQELRGGDLLKQQFPQSQNPFQFLQPSSASSVLQNQSYHPTPQQYTLNSPAEGLPQTHLHSVQQQQLQQPQNEQPKQLVQEKHAFPGGAYQMANSNMLQSSLLPQGQERTIPDSGLNFFPVAMPSSAQDVLGSSCSERSLLNCSQLGQTVMSQHVEQSWETKYPTSDVNPFTSAFLFPSSTEKYTAGDHGNFTDRHSYALSGVSKDSLALPPNALSHLSADATAGDASSMPYAASYVQNSTYGFMDESSRILQGEADPESSTFVKVYKSGSVGRSLDISRFSNYNELREELGQMFGIEGLLDDPLRSGWQLVFVDRENDVLLLGDDPWESFVNNVWYIKILSPEDVQKMGKPGSESYC